MSLGTAVISSNTTFIPEFVSEAGILVDSTQDEQITSAMDELAGDKKRLTAFRLTAMQQAARFSWKQAAKRTLELFILVSLPLEKNYNESEL
jgi:glycosyltransferase involved in cell wall biosynthesis